MNAKSENCLCVEDTASIADDPVYGLHPDGQPEASPVGMVLCPTSRHWQWFPGGPCDA